MIFLLSTIIPKALPYLAFYPNTFDRIYTLSKDLSLSPLIYGPLPQLPHANSSTPIVPHIKVQSLKVTFYGLAIPLYLKNAIK
jgi:hypothetical protein